MKHIFSIIVFCLMAVVAFAVPAAHVAFSHTQADGTVLSLTLVGDEHLHYYINTVTGEAMRQGVDGDYYAIPAAELQAQTAQANTRRAEINQQRIARLPQMRQLQSASAHRAIGSNTTITGSKKGLVILVNFSDKAMQSSHTQTVFSNMFNQEGYSQDGHIGSVHDYFKDQSYSQFDLTFDVVGPVTLSNNMAYYGGNNSSGSDQRPAQMAEEACNLVNSSVNFADYDWDSDGYVDQVFIIYAGYGENYNGADENTIWPHEWDLVSAGVGVLTVDGVKVKTYACAAELYGTSGTNLNGMGTAVHEFSHCLGYPDTYDTDYSGGIGMDSYDVMCSGSYNGPNGRGEVPAGYTAYQRWCAGWLTPTELTSAATITNMPALNDEAVAYIIKNQRNSNEYFLLENRQSKRWFSYFDSNAAGHGLFVMHIDYDATVWSDNEPNDDPDHQRICWVPADGNYGTYSSSSWTVSNAEHKGDFFPGTSNVTTLNGTSHASVGGKWFTAENGSTTFSHAITEITEANGKISFKFDGGLQDDGSRYTITFDACGGSCTTASWTQTSYRQSYVLPEPTTTVTGWDGAGWSLTKITTNTPLDDVALIDYGEAYTPESNVTLYAVYINDEYICHSTPVLTHYTVTFNAGAGSCGTASWTQTDSQQKATLPTPTISINGWSFAGWATTSVAETFAKPTLLQASADYTPTEDITLYAVYKKSTGANAKISSVDEIEDGGKYIFVISDGSTSYAIQQGETNYASFSEADEYATSIIWTAQTNTNGFSLTCNSKYIYCSGDNTTISAASSSATGWVFTALGNDLFKVQRTNNSGRYIGWSGSKFAAYATNNFVNQFANNRSLAQYAGALYIYKIGGQTTYNSNPQAEAAPDPGTGGEGESGNGDGEEGGSTGKREANLMFVFTAHVGQPFSGLVYHTNSNGAATYSSSDTSVATVDAQTGAVTIVAPGETTITYSVAETANFFAAQEKYKIVVEQ